MLLSVLLVWVCNALNTVFDWADNFFTGKLFINLERCVLGQKLPGTFTITCVSSLPQYNVTKAALAISEYDKPVN